MFDVMLTLGCMCYDNWNFKLMSYTDELTRRGAADLLTQTSLPILYHFLSDTGQTIEKD